MGSRAVVCGCTTRLTLLVLLLLYFVSAATSSSSRATRYPNKIKINPGPPAGTSTPTVASHGFRLPDAAIPSSATLPHSPAEAVRASKKPGQQPSSLPLPRQPANFSLPPPLLAEWHSTTDSGGTAEVDVRFDEMYEEGLWRRWDGDCMHARQDEYQYTLCPFHNVTQRGLRLTSLNVALGSVDIPHK